mmetsp:Transcript_9362/g.23631  ORF Transcript_9362/g.23631 Transcript_9362/m.23631 type:complete len:125 (-) Transcript_9362:22-396(-)
MSRRPAGEGGGQSVIVRSLSTQTTVEGVRDAFSKIGDIRDVYMPKDYYSGKPRGFAFVEFSNPDDATTAIEEMDRTVIDGHEVSVGLAQQRRKSPNTMRKIEQAGGWGGVRRRHRGRSSKGRRR